MKEKKQRLLQTEKKNFLQSRLFLNKYISTGLVN